MFVAVHIKVLVRLQTCETYQFGNTGSSTCKVFVHGSNQRTSCPTSAQYVSGLSLAEAKARPYNVSDAKFLQLCREKKHFLMSADAWCDPAAAAGCCCCCCCCCAAATVHSFLPGVLLEAQRFSRTNCLIWKCIALCSYFKKAKNFHAFSPVSGVFLLRCVTPRVIQLWATSSALGPRERERSLLQKSLQTLQGMRTMNWM